MPYLVSTGELVNSANVFMSLITPESVYITNDRAFADV